MKSSVFFTKFMKLDEDEDSTKVCEKLEVLSRAITDVHMMKIFYTTTAMLQKSGVLTHENASNYIRKGLDKTAGVCTCGDSVSNLKIILEKAEQDEYIQRLDLHRFDNHAEVTRMENASFIADIRESIRSNTARIGGLEANVEAINHSVNAIKAGIKRQMKIEATVGIICVVLNAISFGVGGSILDASISVALGSIVDYSDLAHIQTVAEQWGGGCIEQVQAGVDLAMNEFGQKLLQDAVKRGHTLTVLSATAAMIKMQYLTMELRKELSKHDEVAASSDEVTLLSSERNRLDAQPKYLTRKESQDEVTHWLLSHLPRLQEEDALKYCACLIEEGFDSTDVLSAVVEEDLHFMKKAHISTLVQRIKTTVQRGNI